MTSTTRSFGSTSPRSASFASPAVVVPPAVSVKTPVVSASRRMPARISSSVTWSMLPPVRRGGGWAYGPAGEVERVRAVGRVADGQRLGDGARADRLAEVLIRGERARDRVAALGLGAV